MPAPIRDKFGNVPKEGDWVVFAPAGGLLTGQIIKIVDSGIITNPDPKAPPVAALAVSVQLNVVLDGQPIQGLVIARSPQGAVTVGGQA